MVFSEVVVEGLNGLKKMQGQQIALTPYTSVDQNQVQDFANVTRDLQWIHIDVERARLESPFGDTIVHGFHTLGLFPYFLASSIKIKGVRYGINCGLNYVRFVSPIPVGSEIRARIKLKDVTDSPDGMDAVWMITIERKGTPIPSCIAEWVVRYVDQISSFPASRPSNVRVDRDSGTGEGGVSALEQRT